MKDYRKPHWWALYAIVPVMIGMLVVEARLNLPAIGHQIALIGVVLVFVGLLGFWQLASAPALIYDEDYEPVRRHTSSQLLNEHINDEILNEQDVMMVAEAEAVSAHSNRLNVPARLPRERNN